MQKAITPLPKGVVTMNASRFQMNASLPRTVDSIVFSLSLDVDIVLPGSENPKRFLEILRRQQGSSVETSEDDFVAATIAGAIGVGPSIYNFRCTLDDPLGCPFVLEDFVPRSSLHSILPPLTDGQRFAVAEILVQLRTLLSQVSFVAPGMLKAALGGSDDWSRP
ncbi:hypothetical protein BDR22DRAFT_893829 [Usnea florida]